MTKVWHGLGQSVIDDTVDECDEVWHGLGQSVIDDAMDECDEGLAWLGTKCHR